MLLRENSRLNSICYRSLRSQIFWKLLLLPAIYSRQCWTNRVNALKRNEKQWTVITLLSILTSIFRGEPGLASIRMSPFWILLKLRTIEVVVTTGAVRRAKLQSIHHNQQTNTQFLQAGCTSCHPTNSVKALTVAVVLHCASIKTCQLWQCCFKKHRLILIIFYKHQQNTFRNDVYIQLPLCLLCF